MERILSSLLLIAVLVDPAAAQSFVAKPVEAVRVVTWNIGANSIFPTTYSALDTVSVGRPAQFRRVMRALQPDILCLQEASRGAAASAALMDSIVPLPDGRKWQGHGVLDNVLVTRFDLSKVGEQIVTLAERRRGHATALIDLPPQFVADAYFLCAHYESHGGEERLRLRTLQAEKMVEHIRDARSRGGSIDLPPQTGYVVLGDLNVIDDVAPYIDLLLAAGLSDVAPRHNGTREEVYTYPDDAGPYPPRPLDRIFFTAATLRIANSFVLNTTIMSYDDLRRAGMHLIDVLRDPSSGQHDHLPVVVDFAPIARTP